MMNLQHWQLEFDSDNGDNLALLTLDKKDTDTNVLSSEVIDELDQVLETIEKNPPRGLIIKSAKKNGFCAGADVEEFTKIKTYEQAYKHIRHVQVVFDRLENLPCPSLCLIHGFCLGGGLELALACHYRIADESVKTRIGLPEVKLGIHPGYAGSVRLTRLIGAPAAMSLILPGRTVNGRQAKKLGIVSYAVPDRLLDSAARQFILKPPARPRAGFIQSLSNHFLIRPLLGKVFRSSLKKKVKEAHYPSPYAQVDVWQRYGSDKQAMAKAEADSVARLITDSTAQNLIRLFFLQNRLKAISKSTDFKARHIHVIGAGVMGGDIAAWCALRGLKVTLQDRQAAAIAPAIKRAHKLFSKKLKRPREIQHAHDRLIPDIDGHGIASADVIIEAIFEDLEIKQALFTDIEKRARPDAVLASNTSSLRIEDIAKALDNPSRLVGIHFFNPVAQMMLVEIVKGSSSDESMLNKAAAFTHQIGKLPLIVKSSPGFLVNRILMPYLLESVRALEDGIPGPVIDQAAMNFGMPMGPITLADTVGLDICLHVAEILSRDLGGEVPQSLRQMVDEGKLGRKSGEGFYRYFKGKNLLETVASERIPDDLTDRLILSMTNEALQCLKEGVVEESDLMDAGIVFATGFSPFLGGPMQYLETQGRDNVKNRLKALETTYGERFHPSKGW